MRPRFQFPLYKLFLAVAAFAVALRLFSAGAAFVIGTVASILIIGVRNENRYVVAQYGFTTFLGVFAGVSWGYAGFEWLELQIAHASANSDVVVIVRHSWDHFIADSMGATMGAIAGALFTFAVRCAGAANPGDLTADRLD